jgi:glucose uptake protein GlcU
MSVRTAREWSIPATTILGLSVLLLLVGACILTVAVHQQATATDPFASTLLATYAELREKRKLHLISSM